MNDRAPVKPWRWLFAASLAAAGLYVLLLIEDARYGGLQGLSAKVLEPFVVGVLAGAAVFGGVYAFLRRTSADDAQRIAELGARMQELEAQLGDQLDEPGRGEARISELEERIDFAERLLAQRAEIPQLPLHRTPV